MSMSFLPAGAGAGAWLLPEAALGEGADDAVMGEGAGTAIIIGWAPRRSRTRWAPSRRSISLRSCCVIRLTRALTVRTSNGVGDLIGSSGTGLSPVCHPGQTLWH